MWQVGRNGWKVGLSLAWMLLGWLAFLSMWSWGFSLSHSPSYAISPARLSNFLKWQLKALKSVKSRNCQTFLRLRPRTGTWPPLPHSLVHSKSRDQPRFSGRTEIPRQLPFLGSFLETSYHSVSSVF